MAGVIYDYADPLSVVFGYAAFAFAEAPVLGVVLGAISTALGAVQVIKDRQEGAPWWKLVLDGAGAVAGLVGLAVKFVARAADALAAAAESRSWQAFVANDLPDAVGAHNFALTVQALSKISEIINAGADYSGLLTTDAGVVTSSGCGSGG